MGVVRLSLTCLKLTQSLCGAADCLFADSDWLRIIWQARDLVVCWWKGAERNWCSQKECRMLIQQGITSSSISKKALAMHVGNEFKKKSRSSISSNMVKTCTVCLVRRHGYGLVLLLCTYGYLKKYIKTQAHDLKDLKNSHADCKCTGAEWGQSALSTCWIKKKNE